MLPLLAAAAIWGLYNAGLAMVFSFGPTMLVERGWTLSAASTTTSMTLWIVAVSVPLGGFLADRLGQRDLVLASGLVLFCGLMFYAPHTTSLTAVFVGLGLVGGLSAGPIMSLPGQVLAPANRALGMGWFFSIYYVAIVLGPLIAGSLADASGSVNITFSFGAVLLLICMVLQVLFKIWTRPRPSSRPELVAR
jgi:MFS family permease